MKKNLYIVLITCSGLAIGAGSCKKQLTEYNPSGLTSATVYTTAAGFETLVDAAYSYTRFWYGKEEGYSISEMGTDIWTSGTGDVYPQLTQYNNLQGNNTVALNLEWDNFYAAINLCNTGIAGVANVAGYSPQQKAIREGELRFLRAFYYWHIVETWGGVHFSTTPTAGAITTANKTPVDTFYNQIFTDLQFAVANLPPATSDYGRVTVPAAKAFLARMYLTRGRNAEAVALSNDVIHNYGYVLQPKFVDLWNMGNLKNKEVIWVIDYSTNLANNDLATPAYPYGHSRGSNNGHLLYIMVYDQVNTSVLLRDIPNDRPFNRYMPTEALLNLFDAANDSRFDGSFQTVWRANKSATVGGNLFKIGDTVAWTPKTAIASPSTKYTTYDIPKVYGATGVPVQRKFYASLSKFKDSTRASVSEAQSARDVFVIRLAEMYLIAAEAKMKLGDLDSAAYFINVLRTRAAIPGHEVAMQIIPAQINIDFILDERARELCGEQLRWFDLKRTGKLVSRIQAMNPDAAAFVQPFDTVRPITQEQLDAETNKDVLTQNPGYQ
jgi:hypothetical protein